ncbi:MAG: amino acid adenylation domain-containing protein [Gammaproteobacteria bacterium]|nr:amino acid adenylation domain-containing protein [Gammaproteobacteria bacterium]
MNDSNEYVFPLSFAQQRLWFLDRMAPGNPFYNIPLAVPITAYLNIPVLERSLNAIIQRHETLRTVFDEVDGEPSQIIRETMPLKIETIDISHLDRETHEAKTLELATADAVKPFNLRTGPLIRCSVVKRGLADNILLLSLHHIVSDGWSMGILASELTTLYQEFIMGQRNLLPDLSIQYADFTVWQRETFAGEELEQELAYWRTKLRDLPLLDLPTDRPRPNMASYRGAAYQVGLEPELSQAVRELSRLTGATPYMTLMTAFAVLMACRSGQDDIVIGAPIAGRTQPEIEGLIGFFVNSLVFRVDCSGDPGFQELLMRVRDTCLDAYQHQELPFDRLVEEINPDRDPSRNPLFQVTFQLVNAPTLGQTGGGVAGPQIHRGSAIFDIAYTLMDAPDCYRGMIEYSTDLFDAETIARMADEFNVLLEAAAKDPEIPISYLPVCAKSDWRIIDAHDRADELAPPKSPSYVLDEIISRAAETPAAVAIELGANHICYAELRDRLQDLAARLDLLGIGNESRVGLLLDRSPDLIAAQLAAMASGIAYVPLDTSYPADHLTFIAKDAELDVILTQSAHLDFAGRIAGSETKIVDLDARVKKSRRKARCGPKHAENAAYLIYTSGSTGQPKGVVVPHRALANHMRWMLRRFGFGPKTRVLQRTPVCFDASVWEIYAPLMAGGTLVLLPPDAQRDPERIIRCIANHQVNVLQTVPSLLRLLLNEPSFYTCTCLQQIFAGGEALTEDLRAEVADSLEIDITNLYGPTEATIQVAAAVTDGTPEPQGVPIGYPIDNAALYLLNRHLEPVPVGVTGEIWVGGSALARGYIGRAAATAAAFLPDPFSRTVGARMYRTHDLAFRRIDGALLYQGRNDDQIKLRGYRVELGEIESRMREVTGVADCAVFTVSDNAAALVAAIAPETATAAQQNDALFNKHVSQWEHLYEGVYDRLEEAEDPTFNTVGWVSSYSGQDIDQQEMEAWRDTTVERIRALGPRRVLEIGCGTGLLLTQLAPDCQAYVGTDFSAPVIEELRRNLADLGLSEKVMLHHRSADELDDFATASFDTVILNSVVQYFPSANYLADVLCEAVRLVSPGGAIFVGDVRNLGLLSAFHLSLAKAQLDDSATGEDLLRLRHREATQEKELVLDNAFFHSIAAADPTISGIESACKRGGFENELGRFRYDVILRIGEALETPKFERLDWLGDVLDESRLRERLRCMPDDRLLVANIPNARVAAEVRLEALISNGSALRTIGELEHSAEEVIVGALDPEAFHLLAESNGFEVRVRFSVARSDRIEALFWRQGTPPPVDEAPANVDKRESARIQLANDPLVAARFRDLTQRIRTHLTETLPEHMIPALFSQREVLPLTANGKLDRRALTLSEQDCDAARQSYIAPRNRLEEALAIIWAEVLNTGRIGIDEDFFTELGGHSLIAVQLINKVRETLQIEVPLRTLFEVATIRGFAEALEQQAGDSLVATATLFVQISQLSEAELQAALNGANPIGASRAS